MVFGLAISVMLRANLGLDPWSVLHEGLSAHTALSFGRVTQLIGLGLIVFNYLFLRLRPGLGTALNMLLIGPWVDFFQQQRWLPGVPEGAWIWGVALFGAGIVLTGLAIGLYLSAGFGAGPRDDFVLGCALRFRRSVRLMRGLTELSVLLLGFALSGGVGVGTVLFAFLIGPVMQLFLRLFNYQREPLAAVLAPAASG